MITGGIEEDEAVITVHLRGIGGAEIELEAVLDTGFNRYLTLSRVLIAELGLPFLTTVPVRLGNKMMDEADLYEVRIRWNGHWRQVQVQDQGSDERPLVGMAVLRGSRVVLEVVDEGSVTIEPME